MLQLILFVLVIAALPTMIAAAANIDVGFAQDGKATYCQGVRTKEEGPLVFEELEVASAGSCPIAVQITIPSTTIAPNTTLDVAWAASLYTGSMTTNRFPRAVNATTKQASPVVASLLRACKSGSNCIAGSVVEPATVAGDTSTDSGAFDASGKKTLQRFQFQFPTAGDDYVLVGKVVLGGDQILDISAIEFVTFQRIHVGTDDLTKSTTVPATVKPANFSGDSTSSSSVSVSTDLPPFVSASAPENRSIKTSSPTADKKASMSSDGGGINMQTVSIVGVIGIAVVVIVVGYAFIVVREKQKLIALRQQQNNPSPTIFFASRNVPNNGGETAFPAPGRQTATVRKSIAPPGPYDTNTVDPMAASVRKHSGNRAPPPQRTSQPPPQWLKVSEPTPAPPPPPQADRQSSDVTLEYSNSDHSDDSVFSLGDATNLSSFEPSNALADASADHFRENRFSSVALLESSPTGSELSEISSLGSLHDSGEHLAPITRRTFSIDDSSRDSSSVMLEASSYREDGDSTFFRPSSRLYSEKFGSSQGPRSLGSSIYYPRDTSEYNAPYTDRNSESDEWVRRTTDGHYML